jgi:hypothetical protein
MQKFNLTSYNSGKIIKTIDAISMQDAQNILEQKGYDCQDDYFLESVEDATAEYLKSCRYAQIQNLMNYAEENDPEYLLINYRN